MIEFRRWRYFRGDSGHMLAFNFSTLKLSLRVAGGTVSFPEELKVPIAIAEDFLDPSVAKRSVPTTQESQESDECQTTEEKREDIPSKVSTAPMKFGDIESIIVRSPQILRSSLIHCTGHQVSLDS
jgi:hypothetical protein